MRIVTAHYLKRWAETLPIDAESETAELIRSLVRASCPGLDYYRFPGGNASRTHGWDGVTDLKEVVTFVPEGRISIPLAKRLGILPPSGFQTVQDFWDEHSLNTIPPLTEDLLLRGREDRAKRLCDGLSAGLRGLNKWQADSATEAALFVAAALRRAEDELSSFLISKTLFIDSPEGARQMPPGGGFILVLLPETHRFGAALERANQVILALGANHIASGAESLDQMSTQDFAAGLRAMGIDEGEAFRLAGVCCRSVIVFSRLNARGTVAPPVWSNDPELVPLVLSGGWDQSNEHDRAVVATICNKTYEEVDLAARRLASLPDAPLDLDGSIWTVRSPKDAFILTGTLIGNVHQQRLRDACITVFSEIDHTLNVPDEEQPIIPTRGADFHHSEWLRRGLSTTLLLISGLHEAARFRTIGATPEQFVAGVVVGLRDLDVDIKVLASLKSEFPKLIEAAPFPLASALERMLEGDSENWIPVIFRGKKGSPLFGQTSPHTYILWALETLAWNPAYLYRAASILLKLAQVDPGGATQNRPANSLRTIFLAWRPQTYASLTERVAIVRRICLARPDAGFKLSLSLLPTAHDVTSGTSKPRLRDFGDAAKTQTTRGEMAIAYRAYADLAIELADGQPHRLAALIESLAGLEPESREQVIISIRSAAGAASARSKDGEPNHQRLGRRGK